MKQTKITSAQLQTPPLGFDVSSAERGRGAYYSPRIEIIKLDNEISLALESEKPPYGPDEVYNNTPNHLNNNPFNDRMA